MFIKKSIMFVVLGVLFLSSTVFQLVGPITPTAQASQYTDDMDDGTHRYRIIEVTEDILADIPPCCTSMYAIGDDALIIESTLPSGAVVRFWYLVTTEGATFEFDPEIGYPGQVYGQGRPDNLAQARDRWTNMTYADGGDDVEIEVSGVGTAISFIQERFDDLFPDDGGGGGTRPDADPLAPPDPPNGEGGENRPKSCESRNDEGLDWILCNVIKFIDRILIGKDGTSGLLGEIDDLLNISDQYYSDEGLIKAWSYFRNIASLALVLIGLLMVIGQAISKE